MATLILQARRIMRVAGDAEYIHQNCLRFIRKKREFPQNTIEFFLKSWGLKSTDFDYVVCFEKPVFKFERLIISGLQTFPHAHRLYESVAV